MMMVFKHKLAVLLAATLFLSSCDSVYNFAGSDSVLNPVHWLEMLFEDDGRSTSKSSSNDTGDLFEKPSPNPVSCTNSSVCGTFGKCVKKPRSNAGICMVALDADGQWILKDPTANRHKETKKVRSSYGSCSSDFNCPSTFQCDQTYKVCLKK